MHTPSHRALPIGILAIVAPTQTQEAVHNYHTTTAPRSAVKETQSPRPALTCTACTCSLIWLLAVCCWLLEAFNCRLLLVAAVCCRPSTADCCWLLLVVAGLQLPVAAGCCLLPLVFNCHWLLVANCCSYGDPVDCCGCCAEAVDPTLLQLCGVPSALRL